MVTNVQLDMMQFVYILVLLEIVLCCVVYCCVVYCCVVLCCVVVNVACFSSLPRAKHDF